MRAWISADLDGELSELEQFQLRSHLDGCEPCSTFRTDAAAFTAALRDASLEPLSHPVPVPHRRRISVQRLRAPAAAALVVSLVGIGGLFASIHSAASLGLGNQPGVVSPPIVDDQSLRSLRLQRPQVVVAQLRERRAQTEAARIPRHTGFQNP